MSTKSLSDLRRENAPVEDTLPCGLVILRRRNVPIDELIEQGVIPAPLLAAFMKAREKKDDDGDKQDEQAGMSLLASDEAPETMRMLNAVFRAAVISPEIVDGPVDPDDNERMSISEMYLLGLEDKLHVFTAVLSGVMKYKPFRDGSSESGGAGDSTPTE